MSDVSVGVKEDLKFQVAVLFDVVVPVANHYYEPTVSLYNGDMKDKISMYNTFREAIIHGTGLVNHLKDATTRPDGRSQDDAVKITIASVQ